MGAQFKAGALGICRRWCFLLCNVDGILYRWGCLSLHQATDVMPRMWAEHTQRVSLSWGLPLHSPLLFRPPPCLLLPACSLTGTRNRLATQRTNSSGPLASVTMLVVPLPFSWLLAHPWKGAVLRKLIYVLGGCSVPFFIHSAPTEVLFLLCVQK